jgi:ABC-2 type transport system permease protein
MTTTTLRMKPTAVVELSDSAGWRADLHAVRVVWHRELIRFARNRIRMVTSLAQPILFLFVLGTGIAPIVKTGGNFDYRTFMFSGVIAMTILFTAIFSAVSIVWDREFGFLREMLVAPVRRGAIMVGKCLGGATVATFQGFVILSLAHFVHVPYAPTLLIVLAVEMVMAAIMLTALGLFLAARITQVESFQVVMQFFILPMFFLAGALFPVGNLPGWLSTLTRLDPLAYAVDPMRRAVFAHVHAPPLVNHRLNPGITWGSFHLPVALELGIVVLIALLALGGAIVQFSRAE